LNPIFLNLMATLTARSGKVLIRVGGNSQESAAVVPGGLPNDTAVEKVLIGDTKTFTPTLLLSPSLVYAMGNASSLLPIKWFIGVPFNDTSNPRTILGEIAQAVLGDDLIGIQLGNEPDLYFNNGIRLPDYNQTDYFNEFGTVLQDYVNDPNIRNASMFVAPSVCCGDGIGWTPESVFATGFLQSYVNNLAYISVQHYPTNNCNDSGIIDPNGLLPAMFSNHTAVQQLSAPYVNTAGIAANASKPLIMFETNTASCGGFSGLSDSFAAGMWSIDYALNMAANNFSNALFHVGGVSDYYNPFTAPATNQSRFRQWTISNTFYAALIVAETLGSSGQARVVDLGLNGNSPLEAGYAIYEGGSPSRVALFNYNSDPSGASNYTAYISVGGNSTGQPNATPSSVQVKYYLAPSIVDKYNSTWAGQSFGPPFGADGRLQGQQMIYTYSCDTTNNICPVPMPAPAAAIVYLSSQALQEAQPTATETFATSTTATGVANTATVPQAVLATSNGRGGGTWEGSGSTSPGSNSGAMSIRAGLGATIFCGLAAVAFSFGLIFGSTHA